MAKPERVAAQPGVETFHPRIVAGALERIEKVAQRLLAAENQLRQRFGAGSLGEALAEIGGQHDRVGKGRPARGEAPDRGATPDECEHRHDADRGEEAEHKAAHGDVVPGSNPLARSYLFRPGMREAFKIAPGDAT